MIEPADEKRPDQAIEDAPEAIIQPRRKFSIVWVVPLVALLIGGWLAYKAITEKGPMISISFQTAEGLEARKTKIKYKDVEIGQVEEIGLGKDLSHVIITAELVPEATEYLTEETQFYVVRARVTAGEVTGLGTLFSGAYIGIVPGRTGKSSRSFVGLDTPPVLTADLPGSHFMLRTENLGSLDIGSPVYFRQIKVGQVVSYRLDENGGGIILKVFIQAPHHDRVRSNTRFWNASGIDVTVDAGGVNIDTQSLVSILAGGIAFETPATLAPSEPAGEDFIFSLFENRQSIAETAFTRKVPYLLHFNQSVRGLSPGSPVEFRGIKIGQVTEVNLEFDPATQAFRIPVLIEIEPQRFLTEEDQQTGIDRDAVLKNLVARGFRAQLKTGNLLTGQLVVDLGIHPEAPPAEIDFSGPYPELPTIPTQLEELTASLTQVAKRLEKFPLDQIGKDLQQTLRSLDETIVQTRKLLEGVDNELTPNITATLNEIQQTLVEVQGALGSNSPVRYETRRAMKELAEAARSMRFLTDYLQQHPESLIRGKGGSD